MKPPTPGASAAHERPEDDQVAGGQAWPRLLHRSPTVGESAPGDGPANVRTCPPRVRGVQIFLTEQWSSGVECSGRHRHRASSRVGADETGGSSYVAHSGQSDLQLQWAIGAGRSQVSARRRKARASETSGR